MQEKGSRRGLELRLKTLEARIRTLKSNMAQMEGTKKLEELGKIERLERRKEELERLLQELNREAPGFRHEIKCELAKLSYDFSGVFEDFIMSIDSRYRPSQQPG